MTDPAPSLLATRIQRRLNELGVSARGASLRAGLGPDAIRIILKGRSQSPGAHRLAALANALECSIAYLTGETDDPGQAETGFENYSQIPLLGSLENGKWAPTKKFSALIAGFKPLPRIPVRKYQDYHNLDQFALVLLPPVLTRILPSHAVVHIVQETLSFSPRTNDILLIQINRGEFSQRQLWRIGNIEDDFFTAWNDPVAPEDIENVGIRWRQPTSDIEIDAEVLFGDVYDEEGDLSGVGEILGRVIAAHLSLDGHHSDPDYFTHKP